MNYIEFNISQRQVAEYLYGIFIHSTNLENLYKNMEEKEDTNALEQLVFDSLQNEQSKEKASVSLLENLNSIKMSLSDTWRKMALIIFRNIHAA